MLVNIPRDNAHAVDEVSTDDQKIVWKVVNLNGIDEENLAKVNAVATDEPYVKYVLDVDWQCSVGFTLRGKNVIWDLNGHYLTYTKHCAMQIYQPEIIEITDSSADQNGCIESYVAGDSTLSGYPKKCVIVSGGKISGFMNGGESLNLILVGGNLEGRRSDNPFFLKGYKNLFLPNYVTTDNDQYYRTTDNTANAGFAVSRSDIVAGVHNYAYSTGWDLAAGDCLLERLTQKDTPYYLWYRASNTEPYQLLLKLI